jgi:hypothetical protein
MTLLLGSSQVSAQRAELKNLLKADATEDVYAPLPKPEEAAGTDQGEQEEEDEEEEETETKEAGDKASIAAEQQNAASSLTPPDASASGANVDPLDELLATDDFHAQLERRAQRKKADQSWAVMESLGRRERSCFLSIPSLPQLFIRSLSFLLWLSSLPCWFLYWLRDPRMNSSSLQICLASTSWCQRKRSNFPSTSISSRRRHAVLLSLSVSPSVSVLSLSPEIVGRACLVRSPLLFYCSSSLPRLFSIWSKTRVSSLPPTPAQAKQWWQSTPSRCA